MKHTPLSTAQLRMIQQRNIISKDAMTLLREIKRFQYMETLNWNPRVVFDEVQAPKYNVPPGTRPLTLHRVGDGSEQSDRLFWGYKPPWYKRGPASNARLDAVLKGSPFWKHLLAKRIIVPAEGWYEWTGEKGDKQPWLIPFLDVAKRSVNFRIRSTGCRVDEKQRPTK